MAIIREHLAAKGLGLHNDLQNEHSIVGNNVGLLLMIEYGTDGAEGGVDRRPRRRAARLRVRHHRAGPRLRRHAHGDHAVRDGDEWVINGEKTWNTGIHKAQYDLIFARTSGKAGDGDGITALPRPRPTRRASRSRSSSGPSTCRPTTRTCRSPTCGCRTSAIFGGEGRGLQVVQHFFNENRIRQAASSLGAAQFCINESVEYAKVRKPFGKPLAANQGIQFPLVELQTQCEMLRALIHKTAWKMDTYGAFSVSDKVSMCNYWANRLCCEAADRAMQVHGGMGYSRHKPFEHIYRHHRRYRITEGAEEIQMRRVAGYMFGFMTQRAPKGVTE